MILSAGWWGILYPNMSLTEDTFHVVSDSKGQEGHGRPETGAEGFFSLLEASPDEIEIKSKFLEVLLRGKENE